MRYVLIVRDSIAVAKSSLAQQDTRSYYRQLECVDEWWAASIVFVRTLDGYGFIYIVYFLFFLNRGRSGVPIFFWPST